MKEVQDNIKIYYPDNEIVDYEYDTAGQLQSIKTNINTMLWNNPLTHIVTNISYTQYGERKQITYGNGTVTNYDYDVRRRMENMNHQFPAFNIDKQYEYDPLSNITDIATASATSPSTGVLGGPVNHTYIYDNYNRLVEAYGHYVGPDDEPSGMLKQDYPLGRDVVRKGHYGSFYETTSPTSTTPAKKKQR